MHTTHWLTGLATAVLVSTLAAESAAQQAPPSIASRASRCAVEATPSALLDLLEKTSGNAKDPGGVVTIPVYWHVITTMAGGGNVSALIPDQMQVLADAFAGSKFAFNLKSVEVVANNAWFFAEAGSPDEEAMKAALRKGGPESLNIYTTNGDIYLGWATLPHNYKFGPSYDGVVLWWAAMPGTGLEGASPDEPDGILTYDQGDTGTHEVGHWLGLEHTFGPGTGACTHPGDFIKDTPTEAEPQFFCAPRNSCVGSPFPGDDPITNFMDYVDDVCMDNFTGDQTKRMRKHWHAYRDKKTRF
jgi:hypothetical protein